ncbi:MAG: hypothetical protein WA814_11445 [Candidatus Baltobacteraceae bacterium]
MRIPGFNRYAPALYVAVAMLAGCGGGTQSQLAPAGPSQLPDGFVNLRTSGAARSDVVAVHPNRAQSWMAPGAATGDLLYITDLAADDVLVYSYPGLKLVGTLTGFLNPDGECTDKKGDVWIVNNQLSHAAEDAVEYKHGGTKPIATLEVGGGFAVSCSVDPTTGDIAVTDSETYGGGEGNLAIFAHGKGTPTFYEIPKFFYHYFCGYDPKGNLYIDGGSYNDVFEFAELPKGSKKFKNITLKGAAINFGGNVQWDGKYVAVGEQEYQVVGSPPHDDSAVYQTTGAGGKIVHVTPLAGSMDVSGYWIDGKTVVGPSSPAFGSGAIVGFWNYPAGGKLTKKLTGFELAYGAAISLAK